MRAIARVAPLLLLGTLLPGCAGIVQTPAAGRIGRPATPIQGTDADGVPFQLSDYQGQVVLLDFWGNW